MGPQPHTYGRGRGRFLGRGRTGFQIYVREAPTPRAHLYVRGGPGRSPRGKHEDGGLSFSLPKKRSRGFSRRPPVHIIEMAPVHICTYMCTGGGRRFHVHEGPRAHMTWGGWPTSSWDIFRNHVDGGPPNTPPHLPTCAGGGESAPPPAFRHCMLAAQRQQAVAPPLHTLATAAMRTDPSDRPPAGRCGSVRQVHDLRQPAGVPEIQSESYAFHTCRGRPASAAAVPNGRQRRATDRATAAARMTVCKLRARVSADFGGGLCTAGHATPRGA
eukprot:gene24170-biopygen8919